MYEYKVTKLDTKWDRTEEQTRHLQAMADVGWRLAAVVPHQPLAFYWEREKN